VEAAVPNSRQLPSDCGNGEPKVNLTPGMIANPKGMEIGEVKDFVLDLEAGRIAYTVGVFKQMNEMRDRVFVLPWGMVKVDLETNTFILSEGKIVPEDAPNFALDTWSHLPASRWTEIVTAYWREQLGSDFTAVTTPGQALSKASDLVGTKIKDPTERDLGTIEELLLDPETGSIAYAVLSSQDAGNSNRTVFFALPWGMVQVDPAQHTFRIATSEALSVESRHVSREKVDDNSSIEIVEPNNALNQEQGK
jgi:sporulation protein YlmC with PRC-barrel domain